jgi:CubicO group peptidase (beta-lactamase class C family)
MYTLKKTTRLMACILALCPAISAPAAPWLDPAQDVEHLGSMDKVLFWKDEEKVAGFRNMDKITPVRLIQAGNQPLELPEALQDLGQVSFHHEDQLMTTDAYFRQQDVAGLVLIKDGRLVYERYGLGNDRDTLWISFSVTKSVTSLLIGAAIQDGFIRSAQDKVTDYLPLLRNSPYEQASIRNVLQMSSGVQWNEDYADPDSDINQATWSTLELYEYLRHKKRVAAPGEVFNYNTAETNLAGTLLRSAIGNNLATYLSEKIWKPFGMETDATWNLSEAGGGEFGGCCINATLRDYARLGLFALGGGRLTDGTAVLPEGWMAESTTASRGYSGYGYFWWLGDEGVFAASGVFGQAILLHPGKNIVIAMHSAREAASDDTDWALQEAMFKALIEAVE